MSHVAIPIQHYMSSVLVVIEPERTIAEASRLMRLHSIRHLPVVSKGKVVGLISQRDVYLIETLKDIDPAQVAVEEAMVREVFTADPEEPVYRVATEMAERKIGSTVVSRDGKLLGLFTSTDALRALAAFVVGSTVPDR
jgi:CBS domain-containing protein